jgi:hypothetical protein
MKNSSDTTEIETATLPLVARCRIGGVGFPITQLCSRKRRDFSIMPGEREPCTLNRTIGGPQSQSRRFRGHKNTLAPAGNRNKIPCFSSS